MSKEVKSIPFSTQINAVVRKNAVYQRRRKALNCCIIVLPLVFIGLLYALQSAIDNLTDKRDSRCGCMCVLCCAGGMCRTANETDQCSSQESCRVYDDDVCGIEFSDAEQAFFCGIDNPVVYPPTVDIPKEYQRARQWNPDVVFLTAANSPEVERELQSRLIRNVSIPSDIEDEIDLETSGEILGSAGFVFGGDDGPENTQHLDVIFTQSNLSFLSENCSSEDAVVASEVLSEVLVGISIHSLTGQFNDEVEVECINVQLVPKTVTEIDRYLFCTWEEARCNATSEELGIDSASTDFKNPDEYSQAIDFADSSQRKHNAVFYLRDWDLELDESGGPPKLGRASGIVNLIADAWLKYAAGNNTFRSYLLGTQETPKFNSKLNLQLSSLAGILFVTWVVQLLLPMMLVQLVYEKEENLRIMMKMHGLGDAAYWLVNYMYYLMIYILYIAIFIAIGSAADFVIFTSNSYSVLFVFLLLFGNTQIAFTFVVSHFFRTTRGCVIFSFLWIFGSGFIGIFLFEELISDEKSYNYVIELIPAFAAYRGMYEFGEYGFRASYSNTIGLTWSKFDETNNHMEYIMLILFFEWPLFLLLAWYLEQVIANGSGAKRHPLFFLQGLRSKGKSSILSRLRPTQMEKTGDHEESHSAVPPVTDGAHAIDIQDETEDVAAERIRVDNFTLEEAKAHSIIIQNLRKVFPAAQGVPEKAAVKNLNLAVARGEVFGLLGPNGAGKTTAINMLIGFMNSTSGKATIEGLDIGHDMKTLYTMMGVCPQHDLLWALLTGYEHMLFYGRLKGLKNAELHQAAEEALRSVNLFIGGVAKKLVKGYSGGMKRRLSVAISFIGSPPVVYLDEPSTGLDPASRRNLWKVVKAAKQDKAIILTTHNMEEAEVLCDRLGIFVDGRLQVIGNPKMLTARYGGYLVFTLITVPASIDHAAALVMQHFPKATESHRVAGTLKFELPSSDVAPSSVFLFVDELKKKIRVLDWGVATVTLEEVFIKIAKKAGAKATELP